MKIKKVNIKPFLQSERAILVLCMGIAFVFWLFTKLALYYKSEIKVNLKVDLPQKKILVEPPNAQLDVALKGTGWNLMFTHFKRKLPKVAFELSPDPLQEIGFQKLKHEIEKSMVRELEVTNVTPEELVFNVDDLVEKEIPIIFNQNLSITSQYQLASIPKVFPDKVSIKGPASVLKNIESWKTESLELKSVNQDIYDNIGILSYPNQQVSFTPNVLDYAISIEPFTEKILEVPVQIVNATDSLLVFPPTVQIVFSVGLKDYDNVNASQFDIVADALDLDDKMDTSIDLELISASNLVKSIKIIPQKVDYLVIK